jgi:KDO2-lipid IV(A) lauroyltransferase
MRSRFGVTCIESRLGYKTLVATQQQQNGLTLTCLIGDQSPLRKSTKEWVTFLNQETAFLAGADRIAKKLNYAVIVPVFHKYRRGKYEIDFSLITTNAREMESEDIIKAYAKTLEEAIIKQPELWLWTHRRWKLTKANSVF